jgi:hypothetical protein
MTHKHITTIEGLVEMIQRTMASKDDVKKLETTMNERFKRIDHRFDGVESRPDHLDARVGRIEADVHALRDEMVHRQEFQDALDRIQ